jgi:NAD(P)-dependent dehydrogenase (short-subunit alcohol dehydrogenase family)
MRLKDRVAIVTGAGTGIGKAISSVFAAEGAAVVLAGRNSSTLESAVQQIIADGGKAVAIPTNISKEDQVLNLTAQAIKEFGRIDILVNNSAHMPPLDVDVVNMPQGYWNDLLAVNLTGSMMCTREVLKTMIPQKAGSIISISSIAGTTGDPSHSAYSASKWGIIGFTASLAIEVGRHNIRANCISPAGTATEGFEEGMRMLAKQKGMSYEEFMGKMIQHYAMRRVAQPVEIAKAALFLASDDSSAVTGQNLIVSCGFHMIHPAQVV